MKIPKCFIVYILIICPLIFFILAIQISGKVCLSYNGFAVDNQKNIYLGKDGYIEVLNDENKCINKINAMTSRGYRFTIAENNEILISTGDMLYVKNLSGELIEEKAIVTTEDDPISTLNRYKYTSNDGTVYIMKMYFLRTNIYQINGTEKTVIYQMPLFDFIVRLLTIVVYTSMAIIIPLTIIKSRNI